MTLYFMETVVCCLICTANALNNRVVYRFCDMQSGHIDDMNFGPCLYNGIQDYCQVKRNTIAHLTVNFTSHVDTTEVKSVVHGNISDEFIYRLRSLVFPDETGNVRFRGIPEDACLDNNVNHCQLVIREQVHYTNSLFVSSKYPIMAITVRWEIKDDKDKNMVCLDIPLEIVE